MVTVPNAVIFVQPDRFDVHAARCLDYCASMRYEVAGLICGDWDAALRMLKDGLAAVIVVSSMTQLDPQREPRIEVVPKRLKARRITRPRLAAKVAAR
ncbi:hypothetical protein [Paractinoplanes ferrugineus]|uniref:hypothetical protein n=1 Tax=Paractinoplanes ferrugineus TaxID=113564 RepID=UPI0019425471|nr:hypothetical protein [Actinoplanes ferrugineus]